MGGRLRSLVLAARVAGLEYRDANQGRKAFLQTIPDPLREDLTRGVCEPFHVVQIAVIERVVERLPGVVNDAEIDEPPGLWVDRTSDRQLDLERMTMKSLALVACRDVGKAVRRFEAEFIDETDVQSGANLRFLRRLVFEGMNGVAPGRIRCMRRRRRVALAVRSDLG